MSSIFNKKSTSTGCRPTNPTLTISPSNQTDSTTLHHMINSKPRTHIYPGWVTAIAQSKPKSSQKDSITDYYLLIWTRWNLWGHIVQTTAEEATRFSYRLTSPLETPRKVSSPREANKNHSSINHLPNLVPVRRTIYMTLNSSSFQNPPI